MNNYVVKHGETCRCKFVIRWLEAHEKYFQSLPPSRPSKEALNASACNSSQKQPTAAKPQAAEPKVAQPQTSKQEKKTKSAQKKKAKPTAVVQPNTTKTTKQATASNERSNVEGSWYPGSQNSINVKTLVQAYLDEQESPQLDGEELFQMHQEALLSLQPHLPRRLIREQPDLYRLRSTTIAFAVQPPHRISPLKLKQGLYVDNYC